MTWEDTVHKLASHEARVKVWIAEMHEERQQRLDRSNDMVRSFKETHLWLIEIENKMKQEREKKHAP
jgi:hypothetical protein